MSDPCTVPCTNCIMPVVTPCTNSPGPTPLFTMSSVQQEHQTGAHSIIGDRIYRPVFASYMILRVIRNSFISRMRSSLMLLLNTVYHVVFVCIGVSEKR